MPRCTTCAHPDRTEIDQALVDLVPLRHIAKRYGLSTGALRRHRARHLSRELAKAFLLRAKDTFPQQDGAVHPEVVADHLTRAGGDGDNTPDLTAEAMQLVEGTAIRALTRVETGLGLLEQVESLRARTLVILDAAEERNQPRTALKAIAQAADLLKLQGAFFLEMRKAEAEAPPTPTEADEAWELAGRRIYGSDGDGQGD